MSLTFRGTSERSHLHEQISLWKMLIYVSVLFSLQVINKPSFEIEKKSMHRSEQADSESLQLILNRFSTRTVKWFSLLKLYLKPIEASYSECNTFRILKKRYFSSYYYFCPQ